MRLSTVLTTLGAIAMANALPDRHGLPQVKERGVYTVAYSPYADSSPTYNSPPPPASSCASAMPGGSTHYVMVGGSAGLVYTPEYISASVGDVVIFQFGSKNHTLTQSTFPQPCVQMSGGADSGFMPTDGTTMPTFQYTVTTTSPLWFYCQQTGHCKMGMVFAINPPATGKTFSSYKAAAMGGGTSTITATSTTSTTVAVYSPPPYSGPPPPPPPSYTSGMNIGTDGQCQCVCNIDVNNGVPNPNQGLNWFGGQLGNVQVPWGISGTAPPAPAPAPGPPPASAPPMSYWSSPSPYSDMAGSTTTTSWSTSCSTGMSGPPAMSGGPGVQNVQNLGDGTIQPIGDPPAATSTAPAPAPAPAPAATDSSVSDESNDFGGTAGK